MWRIVSVLLAPVLLLACSGCHSTGDEGWTFALSRSFYEEFETKADCFATGQGSDEEAAIALVALFALPFVIDVVLLPVTFTRDLLVLR